MSTPFRTADRTRLDPLVPILEAVEQLEAESELQSVFERSVGDQLDRAVFALVGSEDPTPFQTDPVFPDPRYVGSVVDRVRSEHDKAVQAIQQVLENSSQYPVNSR